MSPFSFFSLSCLRYWCVRFLKLSCSFNPISIPPLSLSLSFFLFFLFVTLFYSLLFVLFAFWFLAFLQLFAFSYTECKKESINERLWLSESKIKLMKEDEGWKKWRGYRNESKSIFKYQNVLLKVTQRWASYSTSFW